MENRPKTIFQVIESHQNQMENLPQSILQVMQSHQNRLSGYELAAQFTGGHDVTIAVFKRKNSTNQFAATDVLLIDSRGFISEVSI